MDAVNYIESGLGWGYDASVYCFSNDNLLRDSYFPPAIREAWFGWVWLVELKTTWAGLIRWARARDDIRYLPMTTLFSSCHNLLLT